MQTMEVAGTVPLNQPRRLSPFRALVWKEWRQQRWVFLSLGGMAYILLALAVVAAWSNLFKFVSDIARDNAVSAFAGVAAFLGITSVVVLSANAFSGERDDNTDLFLETIPYSRSKLFWVKLGLVLFLILMALVPVGIAALVYWGRQPNVNLEGLAVGAGLTVFMVAAIVLGLATVPALIASFGGSVIATILASLPVIGACWAYMYLSLASVRFLPLGSGRGWNWAVALLAVALFTVLVLATILLAARRMWIRIERTWRGSLRTAAAAAGLLFAYVALPAFVAYFYVTGVAPLSLFLSTGPFAGSAVSGVSPNGEFVAFNTRYTGWRNCERAALVSVESGRSSWLTRFEDSFVWPYQRIWSPSGDQFVLDEEGRWLWPLAVEKALPHTYFLVNARSGEKHSFVELCPGLPQMPPWVMPLVGWYSQNVFAFNDGRDILFADIEHHEVHRCKAPADSGRLGIPFPVITQRGLFCDMSRASDSEPHVWRYAPDIPEAESLVLRGAPAAPSNLLASSDGQYLMLIDQLRDGKNNCYIGEAANDAACTLLVSNQPGEKGLISASWHVKGFLPATQEILLYREEPRGLHLTESEEEPGSGAELGLFDAHSRQLRRIGLEDKSGFSIYGDPVQLSPRGGFALVECKSGSNYVVNLRLGTSTRAQYHYLRWLGEDHLLSESYGHPVVINRDGAGARPLLAN